MFRSAILFIFLLTISSSSFSDDKLRVAVASNFVQPAKALAEIYQREYGCVVEVISGSSGKLYAQIKQGAPFDAFLSADEVKPQRLVNEGLAVRDSLFVYAQGQLILWSSGREQDVQQRLLSGDFRHLAIANARLAPYGKAAEEVISGLHAEALVKGKKVMGENISHTLQYVKSGNAQLGFVALSQVMYNGVLTSGSGWVVPQSLYQPVKQSGVGLKNAENPEQAADFLQFLRSEKAQTLMQRYGYR